MKNITLKVAAWAHKAVNPTPSIKKFYELASYTENPTPAQPLHKYLITLDGKTIFTPQRHLLAVPSKTLAQLIITQFNRQEKQLNSADMPMLALCRTAVDADIEGQIGSHLRNVINGFLTTDTLNFYQDYYAKQYNKDAKPILDFFTKDFKMVICPSNSLSPPKIEASKEFNSWVNSMNNWELIGVEQITVWLESIISAYYVVKKQDVYGGIKAASIQEYYQIRESGQTEDKKAMMKYMTKMVRDGLIMYKYGKVEENK